MFNRKSLLIAVAAATVQAVVLLTTACGALPTGASLTNQSPRPAVAPTSQPPVSEPIAAAPETIQVQGAFTTPIQATLTFKDSGRLTEVRVEEGAMVKKGDTLAVLDTTSYNWRSSKPKLR